MEHFQCILKQFTLISETSSNDGNHGHGHFYLCNHGHDRFFQIFLTVLTFPISLTFQIYQQSGNGSVFSSQTAQGYETCVFQGI